MSYKKIAILSLDPGGTTGCAAFTATVSNEEYLLTEYKSFSLGPLEHHRQLWDTLSYLSDGVDTFTIVYESFEYRNQARHGLEMVSREYIGIVRLFADMYLNTHLVKQSPSQAKGFVKNENLKKLGVYKTDKDSRHEMDAYRHLFYYLIHNAKIMPNEFLRIGWK